MDHHIQVFLNRLSYAAISISTLTLLFLFLQTPETCIPPNSTPKPHLKFPKSSCDSSPREHIPIDKKNKRLWSTKSWKKKVSSFKDLFQSIQDLGLLNNYSKVICISAGAGHEVMALSEMGVADVTGIELINSPPLVSRSDPHNLPFFDSVFDLAFTAHLAEALFPSRFVSEMERMMRPSGACVIVVEECGDDEVRQIVSLFRKSRLSKVDNVTFTGLKMTRFIMRAGIS